MRGPRPSAAPPRRAGAAAAWGLAAAVGAVALLRATGYDARTWAIAVAAASPWLMIPAGPLAAYALLRRRWGLAAVAGAVLACEAVWVGPVVWPLRSVPAATPGVAAIRLFDANVSQSNTHLAGIAGEIAAARPDVVAIEELTPSSLRMLAASGVLARFGWSLLRPRAGAGGMGVWSALPMRDAGSWDDLAGQAELRAWVDTPSGPVRLDAVHVYAPVGRFEPQLWRAQLQGLESELRHEPRPLLVAGDFNATSDLAPFRAILSIPLADAAVAAGEGWRMTWPRNQAWVLPYLRIDHVLTSSGLAVRSYRLGTGRGSDHRPLVVEVSRVAASRPG